MDRWERRPLPCAVGYNNCGSEPVFTVVYDANADTVTITSSLPVFADVDGINYAGSVSSDDLDVGVHFNVTSPTTIVVFGAYGNFGGPQYITQLDFFSPGPTLVGTWVGSFALLASEPVITDLYTAFFDVANECVPFACGTTPFPDLQEGLYVYGTSLDSSGAVGVRLTFADASTLDYDYTASPEKFCSHGDGFLFIKDPALEGRTLLTAQAIDGGGFLVGAPSSSMPSGDVYWWGVTSVELDGVNKLTINMAPDQPRVDSVYILDCATAANYTFYDPSGPNAGATQAGTTVEQWDDDVIILHNAVLASPFVINKILMQDVAQQTHHMASGNPHTSSAPEPSLVSSALSWVDTAHGNGNAFCPNRASATMQPAITVQANSFLSGGADGIAITYTGGGVQAYSLTDTPGNMLIVGETQVKITDFLLQGDPMLRIDPIDAAGTVIGTGILVDHEIYATIYNQVGSTFDASISPAATVIPDTVRLNDCDYPGGLNFRQYWNPAGPNAGLNPAGITISSWTASLIHVVDPAIASPTYDANFLHLMSADGHSSYMEFGPSA